MFYEDGFIQKDGLGNDLNYVGWLDVNVPFTKGEADEFFIGSLWDHCRTKVDVMRGFHQCEFCDAIQPSAPTAEYEGECLKLGYYEIRIFDGKGGIYACPSLIFHYVTEHDYLPPKSFIDAVCYGVDPNSYEYHRLLGELA